MPAYTKFDLSGDVRLVEAASAHAGAEFPTDDFTLIVVRAG